MTRNAANATLELPTAAHGVVTLLPSALQLCSATREQEFLATDEGQRDSVLVANGPYRSYNLPTLFRLNAYFVKVFIYFHDGALTRVTFGIVDPDGPSDWSAWSESAELAKARELAAILQNHFGPRPYSFPWGTVSSRTAEPPSQKSLCDSCAGPAGEGRPHARNNCRNPAVLVNWSA